MVDEPVEPRRARGAVLVELAREDLELFGVEELESRIERLEEEIARTRSQLERKKAGRAAADALFRLTKD
ncbi:MAG TPA: DUF1192 domain-containing protein [Caulobacteraceae bacterium]|nr:DUF1192 domain-containing protein [Caulobacteraceae bacterium]